MRSLPQILAAAYILALAALPFGHHDLLCHLKSSTHCTTCLAGTSADDTSAQPAIASVVLADAGRATIAATFSAHTCVPTPSAGRSPPDSSLLLSL
jgi:hypothetical protein